MIRTVTAIILAAGCSSRMGSLKALLPMEGEAALLRQIRLLSNAGIRKILVVTGYGSDQLESMLDGFQAAAAVETIFNPDYASGMFSSVQAGLGALERSLEGQEPGLFCEGFFLLPVDQPLRNESVLKELMQVFSIYPEAVVVPTFHGKKGHPPLLPVTILKEILSYQGEGGLQGFLKRDPVAMISLDMGDPLLVMNMNTREEYEEVLSEMKRERAGIDR